MADRKPGNGIGNSYEVAVDDAVHDGLDANPDLKNEPETWWDVTKVFVRAGNPHIKEYKVSVANRDQP